MRFCRRGYARSTIAEGIAAQVALAQLLDSAAPGGFKIGATTWRMQTYLGLEGPAAGFMPRENLHASGSTLSFAPFLNPGVECELAVHLARDIPPGPCTQEQAGDAVDLMMTAIEIVENRYPDLVEFGTPSLIADQAFHAGAVLGAPFADWRELDLVGTAGSILGEWGGCGVRVWGRSAGASDGGAGLAWRLRPRRRRLAGLRAGQVVMLGSVTPPVWLDGPAEISVEFPADAGNVTEPGVAA